MNSPVARLAIYLVAGASVFIILGGIRGTASIINPILLAAVITVTVLPVPGRLNKRGVPGWLSLVLTILMVVAILALVILTVFFSVTKLSTQVPTYTANAAEKASTTAASSGTGTESTTAQVTATISYETGPVLQGFIVNIVNLLAQFGLALIIFFFMISAAISLPQASRLGLDPNAPVLQRVTQLTEGVRKYMTVLTFINFLVGLGDTVFLLFLGVDYAVLWGMLAWFMGYIPSIGFIIALIPPLIMAYAQYGLNTALWVLVGYILINGGVQNFIQPRMMGTNLRISPVVVFVGLFVWGYLLGGIGAILAVPLTLLLLIIMENLDATRTIAVLMRYTGEEKKEERKAAMEQVRGLWDRARSTILPKQENSGKSE
jgi:predicted PurR-regulated permease PerM